MARMIRKKKNDEKVTRARDFHVILGPVLTEKSSTLGSEGRGNVGSVVALKVDRRANKEDIKEAVERIFKVEVSSVRTINYAGKPKQTSRSRGVRAAYKKAYVSLKEGHRLDLVEGL